MIRQYLNKTVVSIYRVIALFVLFSTLASVLAYAGIMGFYAFDSNWVAPTILTKFDAPSLDLTVKMLTTQKAVEDLTLDIAHLKQTIIEAQGHRVSLTALLPQLNQAIARERISKTRTGEDLAKLEIQKIIDNAKTDTVMAQTREIQEQIEKELKAGLITKSDAALTLAGLNQTANAATDSKVAEVAVRDSLLEKLTIDTKALDTLNKRVELQSEIAQIDIGIHVAEKQIATEEEQINRMKTALAAASQTPYFATTNGNEIFAFASYDTEIKEGMPLYDCYLSVIACRQVGVVKQQFAGELHIQHPIFHTDMRGLLIQLSLTNPSSAHSKTLFAGKKPLLF